MLPFLIGVRQPHLITVSVFPHYFTMSTDEAESGGIEPHPPLGEPPNYQVGLAPRQFTLQSGVTLAPMTI